MKHSTLPLALLVLGVQSSFGQTACLRLGDPPIEGQFTLYGAASGGALAGLPVANGDFDGDGFLDLVATPMLATVTGLGPNREQAGLAYVHFGNGEIAGYVDFASPPTNSLIVYGARSRDHLGDEVWSGDVNGDGRDDLLLCAQDADGPMGTRVRAGALYVIFGDRDLRGRRIDLSIPQDGVVTIHGAEGSGSAGDRLGIWIRSGDLNGDPYEDIVVGADGGDGPGNSRQNCGSAYIIYGTTSWAGDIDLTAPPPGRTVLFDGVDSLDRFGATLNTGDFNGDGRIDVTIGAGFNRSGAALGDDTPGGSGPGAGGGDGPGNSRINCGEAYIFFQPEGGWPAYVDAANPPTSVSMTVAYGETQNDFCGEELAKGDLTQDGVDEWLIGAFPARNLAGTGYILEGGKHLENLTIDLLTPPSGFGYTKILGGRTPDIATDTIFVANVDNDSFNDLLVGSPMAALGSEENVGRVDIFFGGPEFFPPIINLASPLSELRHVCIHSPQTGDILAYSLDVGDWDKDGFADPMPNAMNGDGFGNAFNTAGDAYVVSGLLLSELAPSFTPTPTRTEIPTTTPTETVTATPSETPSKPTNTPTRSADLDGDGEVDAKDLLILKREIEN